MKQLSPSLSQQPLDIVGSSTFGIYPKISLEETFNMYVSDGWLVPTPGYLQVANISNDSVGRGIFSSTRLGKLIAVIGSGVYVVDTSSIPAPFSLVGLLQTSSGNVFIDENDAEQIAICDLSGIYIYNYMNNTFTKATLDFTPGYIAFQDGYFIAAVPNKPGWRLSDPNNGLSWPDTGNTVGAFQTKPDNVVATVKIPSKGNLLFVFGNTVVEAWRDIGQQGFPYQRYSDFNIDYGCVNPATIATNDNVVVWLAQNEKSGLVIMASNGGEAKQISTDGISHRLSQLTDPTNCYGFMYQQDNHNFYQLAFPHDRVSYLYDFNVNRFYTVTDENQNTSIIKRIAFLNGTYYFVSTIDGNVYELNDKYTTFNGAEIPRIRVCKNIRMPDASRFVINNLNFTLEQGQTSNLQRVDLSVSRDGGESFGNSVSYILNQQGYRQNRLDFWNLGLANDFVPQFRFWAHERFIATNGVVNLYQ